jgi:ATP-dependent Lon protease
MSDNPASPKLSLPLLITRGLIVFPNMSETIEVSRLFSMAAVDQAKNVTNSLIFIVSQSKQEIEEPTEKDVFDVGTLCRIINYVSQTKSYRIRVVGSKRVKLSNIHPENGYYLADGEVLADSDGDKDAQLELVRKVVQALETSPEIGRNIPRSAINQFSKGVNPAELADSLAGYLDIPMDQKQAVLAEPDVNKRLEMILKLLSAAQEMAKIDENLQEKVRESAEKSQKEYFLREKMKAIKEELGEGEDQGESEDAIKDKLAKNPYPDNVKAKVKAELHRYEMMPESSLEASLIMTYIDTLLGAPWYQKTEDNEDLQNVQKVLDEDHYGLEKVKKRIIEYLAVKKMTGNLKAPILCFYGPPGCGKTSLGKSIAKALGRKFYKASLGGISDEAEIRGHRRTYVGSMPGRIIQGMTRAGVVNPVFLLDEIDKVGGANYKGDPASALLEVLDPEQNFAFNDNFLEEPYDLSNVLFICTANYLENVPAPLLDRLELIEVPSYTEIEKIKIAQGFLIPKQVAANGLKPEDITFSEDAIKEMIEHYSMEAGVRQLERLVASICRKVVVETP